jgi:hypothetical protein
MEAYLAVSMKALEMNSLKAIALVMVLLLLPLSLLLLDK